MDTLIQFSILIALFFTACLIWGQLKTQNKIFNAQLLKDRITMGWLTDEPMTEEHINNVKFLPDSYILEKYKKMYTDMKKEDNAEKKKGMEVEIGKYLYLAKVYDYFLYVFTSSKEIEDPLGTAWQNVWIKELRKDEVFEEIRKFNKISHPKFEKYLEIIVKLNDTSPIVTDNDSQEQNNANQE